MNSLLALFHAVPTKVWAVVFGLLGATAGHMYASAKDLGFWNTFLLCSLSAAAFSGLFFAIVFAWWYL